MTAPTTSQLPPKSNTRHADKDYPLTVSCFRVVRDGKLPNGDILLQRPLSKNFRTPDEALSFLEECGVAGAYTVKNTLFCRDDAERDDLEHHLFVAEPYS